MTSEKQKVCIIGVWHLGSVYSACLADLGYLVTGVDKNPDRVADLNSGIPPLFEPGLERLIKANTNSGNLHYTTDLSRTVRDSSYILITIDTPVDENNEVDLSPIFDISMELAPYLENGSTIIVSSQVPVGTCDRIKALIEQKNPSLNFDIAYIPENLRLGQAIDCFKHPGRIVIGADNPSTLDKVAALFDVIKTPKLRMNLRTAEMTKHALNAFLATSISFANEIANLCDELGADALGVVAALLSDERIGPKMPLRPGLGFGGGTLARDLKILRNLGNGFGYETHLINGVLRVNEQQNHLVVRKLQKVYGSVKDLTVGVLGLTYKAGTSSLRHSAALEIIKNLTGSGAVVKAYDPKAVPQEVMLHNGFKFYSDPYMVTRGSDAVVILTDWPEFKNLDFHLIKSTMKKPVLIDAKNMLNGREMTAIGFLYSGMGRGQNLSKVPCYDIEG